MSSLSLNTKQKELIVVTKEMVNLIKQLSEDGITTDSAKKFNVFSVYCLSKLCLTTQAINVLCGNGFGEDGLILSRTIFELFLMHAYYSKYPKRFLKFAESDTAQRVNIILAMEKHQELRTSFTPIFLETHKVLIKDLKESVRSAYKEINMDKFIPEYAVSVKDMAIDLKMEYAYDSLYKVMCNTTHNSPRSMTTYIREDENGDGEFKVFPDYTDVELSLVITIDYGIKLLNSIEADLALKLESDIASLVNKFNLINI